MVDFKLTNKQLLAKKLFAEFAEKEKVLKQFCLLQKNTAAAVQTF